MASPASRRPAGDRRSVDQFHVTGLTAITLLGPRRVFPFLDRAVRSVTGTADCRARELGILAGIAGRVSRGAGSFDVIESRVAFYAADSLVISAGADDRHRRDAGLENRLWGVTVGTFRAFGILRQERTIEPALGVLVFEPFVEDFFVARFAFFVGLELERVEREIRILSIRVLIVGRVSVCLIARGSIR